jgi:hypothetical protein
VEKYTIGDSIAASIMNHIFTQARAIKGRATYDITPDVSLVIGPGYAYVYDLAGENRCFMEAYRVQNKTTLNRFLIRHITDRYPSFLSH